VSSSTAPDAHQQEQYWNEWVERSLVWQTDPDNLRRATYVLLELGRWHRDRTTAILDVGCGSGWLSVAMSRFGRVTGLDFSPRGTERLRQEQPDIEWLAGDLIAAPLPAAHYDVVTCLETIAHVPDQEAFAAALARVTRPGGLLVLTTQNEYIWRRTSWLKPPREGQIRNWPSRQRLFELFTPHFRIERLFTCAPGGDRGLPRAVNSRLSRALGTRVFGQERWTTLLERAGFGRSLVLVATRIDRTDQVKSPASTSPAANPHR
jgi:SAM-dependent methyltransferase